MSERDLVFQIVEFVRGERGEIEEAMAVKSVMQLARCNPYWASATRDQWQLAVNEAVSRGLLLGRFDRDCVMLRAAPEKVTEPEQLSLF